MLIFQTITSHDSEHGPGSRAPGGCRHLQTESQKRSFKEEEHFSCEGSQVHPKVLQTSNFLLSLQRFYLVRFPLCYLIYSEIQTIRKFKINFRLKIISYIITFKVKPGRDCRKRKKLILNSVTSHRPSLCHTYDWFLSSVARELLMYFLILKIGIMSISLINFQLTFSRRLCLCL